MKKINNWLRIISVLLLVAIPALSMGDAFASSTGTVAATVTPQNISVSVTDGTVSYGTVDLSSSQNTTSGGLDDTQTATNDGNVAEDFNIESTNATGGTAWTLAGTIGLNQYKHSFCTAGSGSPDPCDTGPTWTAMTTSYQALGSNISASGTKKFDLKIDTPSSVSDFVQKSITVTVQAVIH
jgi:competence protein ComGC